MTSTNRAVGGSNPSRRAIHKKSPTSFWWGFFYVVWCQEALVRTSVRQNRQERFWTSAYFADGPQGEGRTARVILPVASTASLKLHSTSFWCGFFLCGVSGSLGSNLCSTKSSGTILNISVFCWWPAGRGQDSPSNPSSCQYCEP